MNRSDRYTAHLDTFVQDHLPPRAAWPQFRFALPELCYPERVNCGQVLLDEAIAEGHGSRVALYGESGSWDYNALYRQSNRIANTLVRELGVVPGNRVLVRASNTPEAVAAWLAIIRAGAVAVTTMPLLRAKELAYMIEKAQVHHALCSVDLSAELDQVATMRGAPERILHWGNGELESLAARQSDTFTPVDTARDDPCLLAFTSGTTGTPKATVHFHRDVLAMGNVVGGRLLEMQATDICMGSPPLGFTFGLGALLVFPMRFRGASVLISQPTASALRDGLDRFRPTVLFTAPTMYRKLLPLLTAGETSTLRHCVSAGEPLPKAVSDEWFAATGLRIVDGIGATEMIHIFIAAAGNAVRPGATGKPLPGYEAVVLDADGNPLSHGRGRLAVKGPTGCRYLDDSRQTEYVINGWNVTGDIYRIDEDGYFWFEARGDDMIVSSGYNISGAEVEAALMAHPAVSECAVVGVADQDRGQIVRAFIVLNQEFGATPDLSRALQDFVKRTIAPYKYPRSIIYLPCLPKTHSGKIQRHLLRSTEVH